MTSEPAGWVRAAPGGTSLRVHVRPRAARAGLAGFHGDALCVRVTAVPVDEAANRELVRVLGAVLGVRSGELAITRGTHGRDKWVHVRGLAPDAVQTRVEAVLSVDTPMRHD